MPRPVLFRAPAYSHRLLGKLSSLTCTVGNEEKRVCCAPCNHALFISRDSMTNTPLTTSTRPRRQLAAFGKKFERRMKSSNACMCLWLAALTSDTATAGTHRVDAWHCWYRVWSSRSSFAQAVSSHTRPWANTMAKPGPLVLELAQLLSTAQRRCNGRFIVLRSQFNCKVLHCCAPCAG